MSDQHNNLQDNNQISANGNGWATYQRLILANQDRFAGDIDKLEADISNIKTSIAVIQTKALIFGGIAGMIVTGLIELLVYVVSAHFGVK